MKFLKIKYALVILLFGLFLISLLVHTDKGTRSTDVEIDSRSKILIDTSLSALELFEQGDVYFNHDTNNRGVYDIALARQYYEAAIRKDQKGNPLVWYQLGRIDFIEGKFNAAIYKFEKQVEYFPDEGFSVDYMVGLTYGYKARRTGDEADWKQAEDAFKRFIDFEPNAPWGRVDLAWVYFAQGKFEEMKQPIAEGLLVYPDNPWLHNMYALAMMNTGETELASKHFGFAKNLAAQLTPAEWGESYPGNNPAQWEQGLAEFRMAIEKNIALIEEKPAS